MARIARAEAWLVQATQRLPSRLIGISEGVLGLGMSGAEGAETVSQLQEELVKERATSALLRSEVRCASHVLDRAAEPGTDGA